MSKQSVNGSTGDELSLKFLFSNQDGVSVILRFHKSTLIRDVKSQLMQHWPENVTPTDDVKCIRMICMGRGMLQDPQTLDQSKVPGFQTHPTPVNVSVLRKSSIAVPTTPASVVGAQTPTSQQSNRQVSRSTPGCHCVIL